MELKRGFCEAKTQSRLHFSDGLNRQTKLTKPNILNRLTVLLNPAGIYIYRFQFAIP